MKELLVTDGREQVGNSPTKAYAYTYTRGKLRYAGEIGSPMSGISYNCITKRLHASWGGCGNVEYWYCDGCGKYYSDEAGKKEIKAEAVIIPKLKDEPKSLQTGDNSVPVLAVVLLFVSGGAAIGVMSI